MEVTYLDRDEKLQSIYHDTRTCSQKVNSDFCHSLSDWGGWRADLAWYNVPRCLEEEEAA